jgi:flagellin-like protein
MMKPLAHLGQRIWGGDRGITGLETAIVLIAFVVVSSVFAFASLSTGLFSSDKAKETIQAGLSEARGTLEVRGAVQSTATLTAVTTELKSGDATTTAFTLANKPVVPGSQTIEVGGSAQTEGTDFTVNYDTGVVTFTSAPASGSNNIDIDYTWYTVTAVKVTLANAAGGQAVDVTGGETIVTYLDDDTVATNITNYTITKYNADSDNLLETNELFELSIDTSTYGLTDGDEFILSIKPPVGAVIVVGRSIDATIAKVMDLG